MAIADGKETRFGDELSTSLLGDLRHQFPEIPAEVVSSLLKKSGGNMSRCIEELEQARQSYIYGDFVSSEPSPQASRTVHNTLPGTNHHGADHASYYAPERGVNPSNRESHPQNYPPLVLQDLEGTSQQPCFTSWASLQTGLPDAEARRDLRDMRPHLPNSADGDQRHVSMYTVDIHKKPMRTISVPPSSTAGSASPVPMDPRIEDHHGEPMQWHTSALYGRTKSNGMERGPDPCEFPFEPRPVRHEDPRPVRHEEPRPVRHEEPRPVRHEDPRTAWRDEPRLVWQDDPRPQWPDDPRHQPPPSRRPETAPGSRWTFTPSHMQPAEVQSTTQIATSYQLDPPKPSSPASIPQPSAPVTTYNKATEKVTLNPTFLAMPLNRPSSLIEDNKTLDQSVSDQVLRVDDALEKMRDVKTNAGGVKSSLTSLSHHPPERSLSKEKEDQAYTEALLMHQRARFERLTKELEEEKKTLAHMREQTTNMEEEVAHKRHHRAPFPTREEITKLREQKRQLQIDIECMTREIESHKSQGLMDVTQGTSFYGNMGTTGAPGPVPPMHTRVNVIPETVLDNTTQPPPPTYESVMEGQMWSCSACTLLNHPALDKCECCDMPRDK